jgi:rare lipoprotein A (peptidoglycan hydrolase)
MAQLKYWRVGFFAIIGLVVTASPTLAYHHPRHEVRAHREIVRRVVEHQFAEARHGFRVLQMAYEPNASQHGGWRTREARPDRPVTSALTSALTSGSQSGIASWYGASGMTAASLTLRMGSLARVTRDDGRSIVVRIADRGPFIRGRIIDLSRSAARALGIDGLAHVRVDPL